MHNSRTPRRSCEVQSPGGVIATRKSSAASNVCRTVAYYCAEHNRPRSRARGGSISAGSTQTGVARVQVEPTTRRCASTDHAARMEITKRSGAQGASRTASTRLSHSPIWFQLANVRLTSSNTDSKRLESRSQIINPTAQSVHFRIDTHEAGRWRSSPSEGFEPCEDRRVRAPQRKSGFIDRSRLLDCFSLHLEIDGRIPIGRRYTGVAEPLTYRHDVHARSEQVYGGTVAHAMGVQPLARQRRHRLSPSACRTSRGCLTRDAGACDSNRRRWLASARRLESSRSGQCAPARD